jgi:phage tail tape-measure protein
MSYAPRSHMWHLHSRRREQDLEELVDTQNHRDEAASEAIDAVAGAAAGAIAGLWAGPAGAATGAALGAVTGAVFGHLTAERDRESREIENDLDAIDVEEEFFHERRSLHDLDELDALNEPASTTARS